MSNESSCISAPWVRVRLLVPALLLATCAPPAAVNPCLTDNGGCDVHATCTANALNMPTCSCNGGYIGSGKFCSPETGVGNDGGPFSDAGMDSDAGVAGDAGVDAGPGGCQATADCPPNEVCVQGQCVPTGVDAGGCTSASDCVGNQNGVVCIGGHCGCTAANDCLDSSDECLDNLCVPPGGCTTNQQCSSPTPVCDPGSRNCVQCVQTSDCPSGDICVTDTCTASSLCSVCICDDETCPIDSSGDCDDFTNCLVPFDAGFPVDAGVKEDAGAGDAGHADAGHADAGHHADAGAHTDAGVRMDAGSFLDAGSVADAGSCPCTCIDGTCATDSLGTCDDGSSCCVSNAGCVGNPNGDTCIATSLGTSLCGCASASECTTSAIGPACIAYSPWGGDFCGCSTTSQCANASGGHVCITSYEICGCNTTADCPTGTTCNTAQLQCQ